MKSFGLMAVLAAALIAAPAVYAQQASAPAGSTGQCKDGSYSSQASKRGACKGHQGVKEWYSASSAATPAASKTSKSSTTAPAMAAASATPAAAAAPAKQSFSTPSKTVAPGGGPGKVWVNSGSKVYHCQGDKWYGTTKKGQYMTEADAKAAGNHAAAGKSCSS